MKIFVAGASGALGRRLVPLLVDCGFDVVAMTRSADTARMLRDLGAEPVVADGLVRSDVMAAVQRSEPEVVIHQMTGLTGVSGLRNFDKGFARTNRLRTEGTDNLLAAAVAAGARRFIAQSYGNWNYEREGTRAKREEDRFDPHPPAAQRRSLDAIVPSSGRSSARRASRASRCATATSTAPGRARGGRRRRRRSCASAACPSSARARRVVVRPRRRCRDGDAGGDRPRRARASTTSPTTSRRPSRTGCRRSPRARRAAAAPRPRLARPAGGRRGRRVDDDPDPRRVERQGQARARLAPPVRDLPRGLPGRARRHRGRIGADARVVPHLP